MQSSTGASDLALLERAELAARERRLTASAEAERIVAFGRERAAEIAAHTDVRVAEALDQLRASTTAEADEAIAALRRAAGAGAPADTGTPDRDAAVGRAIDLVLAAVLAEALPGAD